MASKGEKSLCTDKWADRLEMNQRMCQQPVEKSVPLPEFVSSLGQPGGRNRGSVYGHSEGPELWEVRNSTLTLINDPSMGRVCSLISLLWSNWNVPHRPCVWVLGSWLGVLLWEVVWWGVLEGYRPALFPGWVICFLVGFSWQATATCFLFHRQAFGYAFATLMNCIPWIMRLNQPPFPEVTSIRYWW